MRSGLRLKMGCWPSGPVRQAALPERAVVALPRHRPAVEPGARVLTGSCIALPARPPASPLHSPVTGVVEKVTRRAIVIGRSGDDQWATLPPLAESAGAEELRKRLFECGVSALVPGGIPTGQGSSVAEGGKLQHLVLALSVTEPFLPDPLCIIHGRLGDLALGLRVLSRALGSPTMHLAGAREDLDAVCEEVRPDGARFHALPRRHPAMSELMLAYMALDRPRRLPRRAVEAGVLVVDVQVALAAADAAAKGRAVVERVVALGGDGFRRASCARCRLGARLEDLLAPELRPDASDCIIVRGGALSGSVLAAEARSEALARRDTAFAALTKGSIRHTGALPCVTCGFCADVCPVGLAPYVFHRAAGLELVDEAESSGLETCVECGLCSYVCPSRLDILAEIRELKGMLAQDREAVR